MSDCSKHPTLNTSRSGQTLIYKPNNNNNKMKNSAPNIAILKEQKAASALARYIRGLPKKQWINHDTKLQRTYQSLPFILKIAVIDCSILWVPIPPRQIEVRRKMPCLSLYGLLFCMRAYIYHVCNKQSILLLFVLDTPLISSLVNFVEFSILRGFHPAPI